MVYRVSLLCYCNKVYNHVFRDSSESPKWFTMATHKCVSLCWGIFLGTFKYRKVIMYKFPCINVLMSPCINVRTKPDIEGKLNQWKIWKTEPTEYLHQPSHTFKCRKLITCINVLRLGTLSYLECWNWTKDQVVWWSAIMEKIEKCSPFHKYWSYRKISNYHPSPKV